VQNWDAAKAASQFSKQAMINLMGKFMHNVKKHVWSYVFIVPMAILFLGFTVYPLLSSVRYTFYNWSGIGVPKDFVGFKHYINIAKDPFFWNAFRNTFIYAGVLVPVQLSIALVLAVILNSKQLRLKYIFRVIFFSPVVTSTAIVGIVISLLSITAGSEISRVLVQTELINRPIDWLGDPRTAMWIVISVGTWIGLGYPLMYFLAGLQAIDQELYDAAKVDGAGNVDLFWYITVPSIRPVGIVVLLVTTLHSLRVFDIVQVMTKGGPYFATEVVGTYIYRHAFFGTGVGEGDANLGFASAAAFFMGILVMFISVLQVAAVRYAATYRQKRP